MSKSLIVYTNAKVGGVNVYMSASTLCPRLHEAVCSPSDSYRSAVFSRVPASGALLQLDVSPPPPASDETDANVTPETFLFCHVWNACQYLEFLLSSFVFLIRSVCDVLLLRHGLFWVQMNPWEAFLQLGLFLSPEQFQTHHTLQLRNLWMSDNSVGSLLTQTCMLSLDKNVSWRCVKRRQTRFFSFFSVSCVFLSCSSHVVTLCSLFIIFFLSLCICFVYE